MLRLAPLVEITKKKTRVLLDFHAKISVERHFLDFHVGKKIDFTVEFSVPFDFECSYIGCLE